MLVLESRDLDLPAMWVSGSRDLDPACSASFSSIKIWICLQCLVLESRDLDPTDIFCFLGSCKTNNGPISGRLISQ
ncbi:hypothetical protein FKM82_022134 [Ascaphus truei]